MTTTGLILLVDDEEKILKTLGRALRDEGHRVVERGDAREARGLIAEGGVDVLVVDNLMPGLTGLELIRDIVATVPESDRPQIVMMTAHATVADAIEAMKLGALDFLQKPFEIEHLLVTVSRAVEHQRLRTQHRYLLTERDEEFNHYGIVGRSRLMQDVIHRAERVAETRSTVLITGETGTGKELVARAIHDRSAQRHMPLIKVNCAAIPETLLESELFGHVRGAFTGATTNKKGRFALANGGSIFLDEIGIMPGAMQPKLLRVLQEREFEPLGSERTERVDVRVIAATNRDLRQLVGEGRFQEDLFYRLNVIPVHLPPLRDRREDIPVLAEHFIAKHAQRTGKPHRSRGRRRARGAAAIRLAGQRARAGEHDRARGRAQQPSRADRAPTSPSWRRRSSTTPALPALHLHQNLEWAERETVRQALEQARGREEGCGRADGHQPARAQLLPGEIPNRGR